MLDQLLGIKIIEEPQLTVQCRVRRGFWERLFSLRPWRRWKIVVAPDPQAYHVVVGPREKYLVCHPVRAAELKEELGRLGCQPEQPQDDLAGMGIVEEEGTG